MDIKSDTLILAGLGLPPAKLDPRQIGVDVIFKNVTKPCARLRNPQFWSYTHPRFLGKEMVIPIPLAQQSSLLEILVYYIISFVDLQLRSVTRSSGQSSMPNRTSTPAWLGMLLWPLLRDTERSWRCTKLILQRTKAGWWGI